MADQLAAILGSPPEPTGSWEREAVYLSAAALRAGRPVPQAVAVLADEVRALPGVARVRVRTGGFMEIEVAVPGEIVAGITGGEVSGGPDPGWPDRPRTFDNPGFVVRFACSRALAVQRWARDLGVPPGPFAPRALTGRYDRAVLRVLAELPGRRTSRDPGWPAYLVRLALAYHDAHERAPAVPVGDQLTEPVHTARVRLAGAVRLVLTGGLATWGETVPDRL